MREDVLLHLTIQGSGVILCWINKCWLHWNMGLTYHTFMPPPPLQFSYKLYHRSGQSCSPEWVFKLVFLDNSYSYSAKVVVNMHSWRIRNKDVVGYLLLLLTAHCIMGYVVILTNTISTIAEHLSTFNVISPILKVQQVGWVRLFYTVVFLFLYIIRFSLTDDWPAGSHQ